MTKAQLLAVGSTAELALSAWREGEDGVMPRQEQKQVPVGIRNFRCPAGLALPPLPCNGGDADEARCLAGRQTGRLAGGLDDGGVAHAATRTGRHAARAMVRASQREYHSSRSSSYGTVATGHGCASAMA